EASILLLDGDPVQPELTHLGPQVARKLVRGVDLRGDRLDLVLGKAPRRLADRVGHLAEVEIECRFGHGNFAPQAPLAERVAGWNRIRRCRAPAAWRAKREEAMELRSAILAAARSAAWASRGGRGSR